MDSILFQRYFGENIESLGYLDTNIIRNHGSFYIYIFLFL